MVRPSRYYTEPPYHVRKTIAFDGAAGNGAIGTVVVFAIVGRVFMERVTVFCTEDLAGATATIQFGTVANANQLAGSATATDIDANDWYLPDGTSVANIGALADAANGQPVNTARNRLVSANLVFTIGVAAITDGTLIVDAWYDSITDNGELVGD